MARLNQIIALHKGVNTRALEDLTDAHHKLQKAQPMSGISRTYQPKDEEGETLPPESTRVQVRAEEAIRGVTESLSKLFDVTASLEYTNHVARANVLVDGKNLLEDVPVTYLLFLEKQLVSLHTFVQKLPVLDPAETWEFNPDADCYATPPVSTTRTKKVPKAFVKYEATVEHPAQVDVFHEDVIVGTWRTVKFSGALPAQRVNELLGRVTKLQEAVKLAREEANNATATEPKVGAKVLSYLFG